MLDENLSEYISVLEENCVFPQFVPFAQWPIYFLHAALIRTGFFPEATDKPVT